MTIPLAALCLIVLVEAVALRVAFKERDELQSQVDRLTSRVRLLETAAETAQTARY